MKYLRLRSSSSRTRSHVKLSEDVDDGGVGDGFGGTGVVQGKRSRQQLSCKILEMLINRSSPDSQDA